jgi:hypothetical protein
MQDSSKPIWINKTINQEAKKFSVFVATPVHSEVSIHYTQACIRISKRMFCKNTYNGYMFAINEIITSNSRKKFMCCCFFS